MKKLFTSIAVAAVLVGINQNGTAETNSAAASSLIKQANAFNDSQLGAIAAQLTGAVGKLDSLLAKDSPIKGALDSTFKSLTGGRDSEALTSTFNLVKGAKFTPEQMGIVKEISNLTSAYVVQKNFTSLEGSKSDVAAIVSSLREGKVTAAVTPLKNVASNAHLTDGQKHLITTVADKYAPGWRKAGQAVDAIKKLPSLN